MYYEKRMLIFIMLFMMPLFCGCQSKEVVMLTEEFGQEDCTSQGEIIPDLSDADIEKITEVQVEKEGFIYVYISGEVKEPGVYQMQENARIYEVLTEAGGYTFEADESLLNLAGGLVDGMQIHVPNFYQEIDAKGNIDSLERVENADGLVNLNTASKADLESIPGIGEVKAALILSYRTDNGNFKTIEEIMQVDGIKEGTFEKIKDYIKVIN